METKYYKSKIDWWFWILLLIVSGLSCMLGYILEGHWIPDITTFILLLIIIMLFFYILSSVKYAIRGKEFGIRGLTFKWEWFPIEKIETIQSTRSILASSALSFQRIAIKFSDKNILKSSMPLEIAPKDSKKFINDLIIVNPGIKKSGKNL